MPTVDKNWKIRRRLEDFVWRSDSAHNKRLRIIVENFIARFGTVGIVGGMIRDIALAGAKEFKSDVDFVLDAPADEVRAFAETVKATENRFGGFSYSAYRWKIDFWAREETWAFKNGLVDVGNLSDVTRATFFVNDAVVYDLQARALYAHTDFLNSVIRKELEINLWPNPSVQGNLVRAVRRLLKHDLTPGPRLSVFLDEHLSDELFEHVVATECRLYGWSYAAPYGQANELLTALNDRQSRSHNRSRQIEFTV
jgi:hypothetical protein